jgi:peroxiredoxin Q/BCP
MLDVNDMAPDFSLPRDGGGTLNLADFKGKALVLFFYPKDDTSGCTKESIGFSEALQDFSAAGAAVVGVSKDSVKSHDKFVKKHDLSVPLLSDEESTMCEDYGVWAEKSMYGKSYMGIERSTFLIDGEGRIVRVWRKVKVPGHVDEVLAAVKAMG